MKNVIIGTAGHIDHGKSTLIRAITGRETDRLKEEVERGISIELGFTYFDLPSGRRAGIVDVPGHEKFVKNMLAGITGIDVVVLAIAADEGIMPQTKEHLDILDLIGIKKGIIAITKSDMVDKEWLELVQEDIREGVAGTFLQGAEMIPVSSTKGEGIDKLVAEIDKITEVVEDRDIEATPRLPVDRVFTISGFGTVVTGTLISGKFKVGDTVNVYPKDIEGRIRSIQVHGESEEQAFAGQRVAVNVVGPKKSEIDRGNVIAPIGSMESTMMLDVKLRLLEDSQRIIENRTRVRLYIGSSEILCRVVLLDKENLTPGEECFAQLRLEESIVAKSGDRFIVRFYSPMMTIGGGEVLESNPDKKKRFDEDVVESLKLKEKGDILDIVGGVIKSKSPSFPSIKDISVATTNTEEKVEALVSKLLELKKVKVYQLSKDRHLVHIDYFNQLKSDIIGDIGDYHKQYPFRVGISKEEIRNKHLKSAKQRVGELIIAELVQDNHIKMLGEKVSLPSFKVEYLGKSKEIREKIEKSYLESGYNNLKIEDVVKKLSNIYSRKEVEQIVEALFESDELVKLKEGVVLHRDRFEKAKEVIVSYIEEKGKISIAEVRDLLDTNRKVSISVIETLDDLRITKREDDHRILN